MVPLRVLPSASKPRGAKTTMQESTRRYAIAFLITGAIFATALAVSVSVNNARVENIRAIQENISTDILSLETQFDLLSELSCKDIRENSVLSKEVANLSRRLAYMESKLGTTDDEVVRLKRQYSLLQIKDLLLMKRVSQKCKLEPVFILYFYSNDDDCVDCERQGYALTELAERYPKLRIYSFDYNLDLPALNTLITINDLKDELPAVVIDEQPYYGFQPTETLESLIPQIETLGTTTAE